MKRLIPVIMILMIVALSGCTGQDASSETEGNTFARANLNLNGKMMDIELLPTDSRAGEKITANLVVGNTGSENIVRENIEIKVKPIYLNDFLANIAVLAMSESKKTISFSNEYNEEIKPGMIKPLSYVFPTPQELKGKNLAGTYSVTIILSVNGQNVESRTIKMKLRSGKPREIFNTPVSTPSGTVSATSTPTVTKTAILTATPTPAPTPVPVTVDTFVFGWDDVPGKDKARLIEYLKKKYNLDWVETARVEKIVSADTINLTSGNKYISLSLIEFRTKLKLIIDDGRSNDLLPIMENGKVNVYSGKFRSTKIKSLSFTEKNIQIDAGDWLQWFNEDIDETYILAETSGKMANMTVTSRKNFLFNTTGTYTFKLFYTKMKVEPPVQVITVK